jgi:hypothetical protein
VAAEKLFVVFGTARRDDGRLALLPHLKAKPDAPPSSFVVELVMPNRSRSRTGASCTNFARETWAQPVGCLAVCEVSLSADVGEVPIGTEVWVLDD